MKIKILLAITIIFFLASPVLGGITMISGDGYGNSKNEALLQAKREAVSSGIGTLLISETEVNNYMLQKDLILTRTVGAVKSYKIIDESKDDGLFHVKIRAEVSMDAIKEDLVALKILLESMDKPRMMVLISEEKGNAAETAILDYLNGKEFELVDASVVAALMDKDEALVRKATEGDPVAAAQLGAANGAEFIIVGKVVKSTAENKLLSDSGMVSGQANITARVVNCSNARIIASKSAQGAAAHSSLEAAQQTASEKAARKLMDDKLFEKIISSFQDMVNNGMTLELTVVDVPDYNTQKAVQNLIKGLNVSAVSQRGFGSGELKLSVVYRGNADGFADMVNGKTVLGKKLSVIDIAGSQIKVKLQ
ncbi:MAG: hypothetical protein KKB30_02785 [Proteobacteria bacterium]|nr:hypothetical protein [Pseudomonadota bacterium]MBU1716732.1 hypothetical protein [Pseudomonadota bacterium]